MPQARPSSADASKAPRSASFAALYEAHVDKVYAWALRYARGRTQWAEDVTHDVFLKAFEHQAWLREDDVSGWLFRVTQNAAYSALRREQTVGRFLWRLFTPQGADAAGPEATLERREAVDRATEALNRLPAQERVVMALKTLDDLSQREIATLLSLSEGYVSKLLRRAQERLSAWGWKVDDEGP